MRISSRKLAAAICGGHQPRDVALAIALGVLAGALTGGNISWAVALLAALLFNVHSRSFLAAWLASLLLSWLGRGPLETAGRALLDGTPLGYALGRFGDGTLVAFLGWHRYVVVGGAAVGGVTGVVCACAVYRAMRRWSCHESCGFEPGSVPRQTAVERPAGQVRRGLVGIWLGTASCEELSRPSTASRRLRQWGIPVSLAASCVLAVTAWSLAGWMAKKKFFQEFSVYNGAQVSAAHSELSLWSGRFVVRDLQIADPRRLDRDRVRIGIAKGKLSPGLLLRGSLDVEKLVLEEVKLDVARRAPGRLYGPPPETTDLRQPDDVLDDGDAVLVDGGLRHWRRTRRQLDALRHVVVFVEQLRQADECADLARERSPLGTQCPHVAVRQLRIVDLSEGWNLGRKALLEVKNLSSNPALLPRETELKVILPQCGAELALAFALKDQGQPHTLRCSAFDLDVTQLVDSGAVGRAVALQAGRVRLSGEGTFDRDRLDVSLQVDADSLSARVTGGMPLAGVEPAVWNAGLARLASFRAELELTGAWSAPHVVADRRRFVAGFQRQLLAVGEEELASTVERQFARYEANYGQVVVQASAVEAQPPRQQDGSEQGWQATSPPAASSQPGFCEFSENPEPAPEVLSRPTRYPTTYPIAGAAEDEDYSLAETAPPNEGTMPSDESAPTIDDALVDLTVPNGQPYHYPSTAPTDEGMPGLGANPSDDAPAASRLPARPTRSADAAVAWRHLPGPVNMVVGHDPSGSATYSVSDFHVTAPAAEARPRGNVFSRWTQSVRQKIGQAFAPRAPEQAPDEPPPADRIEVPDDEAEPPTRAAASEAWYNRRWR
ncbi:MAG TPA: hypothetical protein VHC22_20720 [Pirellulales bacterium]|nr:hypothetical protein [Pirellulales bacterium]